MEYEKIVLLAENKNKEVITAQVELTDDQRVALNMAIFLLSRSNSDHADQCVYHLKTI